MTKHKIAATALAALVSLTAAWAQDPLVSHINHSVRAQDDFFEYANGAWFAANPIPSTEKENGIFRTIEDTVNAQIYRMCLKAAAAEKPKGSAEQKIGDFYLSGMDSVALNRNGINEIKPMLKQLGNVDDLDKLVTAMVMVNTTGGRAMFGYYVGQDDKNSAQYALQLWQGGLTLPDRNYYLDTDDESLKIRKKFAEYATYVFRRIGYDDDAAAKAAQDVIALETELASHSRKREDLRDPQANYNKMSMAELGDLIPNFHFSTYNKSMGLTDVDSVIVGQPEFFAHLNGMLLHTPMKTWGEYLQFQWVNALATYADDALYAAHFDLFSRTLRGVPEMRPRWKRVTDETNSSLGDLLGQLYVKACLPEGTKEKFLEIGNAVRDELALRIKNLDWMSDATKLRALDKLAAVRMKLGWPDKWRDMSSLSIDRSSYLINALNISAWYTQYNMQKLGKPVDRDEWGMQPQTYNAYYSPSNNEICIPGCNILIPGFDGMPDDAVLYAIIGGTFGHEITHGFDDQGCQYDKEGNLKNWWTARDKKRFDERTAKIVTQFDGYFVAPGLHINGSLTQGENIADLGGTIIALEAYKKTADYKSGRQIGGFTPLQRFFLAYAHEWMEQFRPEALRTQVKSNEHAPAKWRVLGPLSNIEDFYTAFDVKKGDKMYVSPDKRVSIW